MSNLLKDASILLTPTAYENGRMNAIKPYKDLYGPELVTNGDFGTVGSITTTSYSLGYVLGGSSNLGVSIVNNALVLDKPNGTNTDYARVYLTNGANTTFFPANSDGKKFKLRFEIKSKSGQIFLKYFNNGYVTLGDLDVGIHTIDFIKEGSSIFVFKNDSSTNSSVTIDNISIVEDLSGDFTFSRNSAATRVNAQGLVENVQIISDELVSNGNFSQIGTEEVSNGDFSQIGAEEVSNGNFSQEGSELVTNGDFATDGDWVKGTNWTISGGKANCDGVASTSNFSQVITSFSGKTFLVEGSASNVSQGFAYISLGGTDLQITVNSNGSFKHYVTISSGNSTLFISARNNFIGSIDNVSVKEVGQDWVFSSQSEIIEDAAKVVSTDGSFQYVQQSNFLTIGKTYKLTLNVLDVSAGSLKIGSSGGGFDIANNFNTLGVSTFYFTANGDDLSFSRVGVTDITITNISVKEVGQDWALSSGASLTSLGAKITHSPTVGSISQSSVLEVGKQYKITYEITENVAGGLKINSAVDSSMVTTVGAHTKYFEADLTNLSISRTDASNNDVTITNISVKEVGQDWTFGTGWSVDQANSKATFDGGADSNLTSSLTVVNGTKYRYKFDVSDMTAGGLSLRLGAGNVSDLSVTSNGTYEGVTTSEGTQLLFRSNSSFDGSISNISVKEITDDTDLPRINYEGFSYQDSLGSEEIVNGDFSNGSANWGNYTSGSSTIVFTDVATLNVDASNSNVGIYQENVFASGKQYKVVLRIKASSSFDAEVLETQGAVTVSTIGSVSLTTSYQDFTFYFTGTGTNDIFIHRKYSSSSANQSITIDNVSVKEYLGQEVVPDSGCGSWLMEGQSTNLITYSEDFSQWNKQNSGTGSQPIITSNNTISPDGNQNADKIVFNKGAGVSASDLSVISSDSFTAQSNIASFYIKADSPQKIVFRSSTNWQLVDVTTEWQRISKTDSGNSVQIGLRDGYGISGIPDTATIYLWGVQAEAGSYSTSYVPTSGATSTRLADVANNSGNSTLINSTEGVLYAEIAALANDGNFRMISISDGSNNNRVRINYTATNQQVQSRVVVGGVTQAEINEFGFSNITDFTKIALLYKENEVKLYINGTLIGTDTSASMPSANTFDTLNFNGSISNPFYGKNKALAVYKEALTDANLRCLTYPNPVATTFDLDFDTIAEQFTFTRGSEATFVNEQGLIESTNQIGPELVTNGDFATDSDWTKQTSWSISGGSANYDFLSDAKYIRQTLLNGGFVSGKTYKINFEITSGTAYMNINSNGGGLISLNSYSVGSYSLYTTASVNGSDLLFYGRNTSGTAFSIDNVSVKEVISATNTPRIDYSTGEKAFLLEPQSTNLVTYSEDFSQWNNTDITIGANGTSPSGEANANLIQTGTTNTDQVNESFTISPTNTATYSVFIKRVSGAEWVDFLVVKAGFSNSLKVWFNISNGTVGSNNPNGTTTLDSASVEDFGNGWYRLKVTTTDTTNNTAFNIRVRTASADGSDTRVDNSSYYLWGAQLEQQSYATSYIPTNGAAATRNQELCNNATPVINSEEGTLYAEISALEDDLTFRGLSISDGTTSNACRIYYRNSSNRVQFLFNVGGASQFQQLIDLTNIKDYNKIAFSYKKNNFKVYINGVKVAEDTNGIVPSANTFNKLSFSRADGGESFFGNTKGLKVYPKALADVQLEDLTTI